VIRVLILASILASRRQQYGPKILRNHARAHAPSFAFCISHIYLHNSKMPALCGGGKTLQRKLVLL
jgi:hypothetical protein